ncbi:Glycosyltransferase involved in cell wall bisynthesis [bacterium A37T11]|nr:Glycosyltransferase involved in cell wall bisynthesis [bacterium A37T11]
MRILVVHNFYQHPGGEDTVFNQEADLLKETELVYPLTYQNYPGFRGLWQTCFSIWNIFGAFKLRKTIRKFRPDLIHFHNFHYALGPIGIRTARKAGIPVVITLHNYRLICPSATLFYNGQLFTDSLHHSFPWKAIRLGVHSHSSIKTAWLAFTNWLHKKIGTWKIPARYIVLTPFAKDLFVHSSIGIPANKFTVKPNAVQAPKKNHTSQIAKEPYFLFIGRLTEEKGIKNLVNAFMANGYPLHIAGDGPLRSLVESACTRAKNITYLGTLDAGAIYKAMAQCTALIFPSIWFEGMPLTMLEAFSAGTAIIASNLGAMASMIQSGKNGLLFEPHSIENLNEQISYWVTMNEQEKNNLREQSKKTYEECYTASQNLDQLLAIYQDILSKTTS